MGLETLVYHWDVDRCFNRPNSRHHLLELLCGEQELCHRAKRHAKAHL